MKYTLVYQNGIANVFDANFKRVLQHAFSSCEWFCRGLISAGHSVEVMHCDVLGDLLLVPLGQWRSGKGSQFDNAKMEL